jgi:enoyl-CoA hydratase/carnithine racemase
MGSREVVLETGLAGDVWITINRPQKHNALARTVLDELADEMRRVGSDRSTRYVVLRGAGEKYFAAGGDLVDLAMVRTEEATCAMADGATAALDAVRNCPVPVIAYVNGDALGGGAELAVACDMRIVEAHARIGFVHGRVGITSAWGGGPDLYQLVGAGRAMRMMSRCEMIDAQTALSWGLVDVVVTGGAESADVRSFLKPFFDRSPLVLRSIKEQALAWRQGLSYAARREVERKNLVATWLSSEHWLAVDRFLAKEKT